ncbi:hypothetical protein [Microbulbifer spongiae]|uniref:Uncharacterized protein n=1 Tax=Microbulbifer spongiae TaxID=2944933 RepID=A0ABY9EET8_9GAMM|nr:hypothetical protein [Microbulbifer sp. MI-G]WKD50995.1 hypothetical protein M8T91_06135 [Microbulbifer sp. MI-G]
MESSALNDSLKKLGQLATQAERYVSELKLSLREKKVTAKIQEDINTFDKYYEDYSMALEAGADRERMITSASHIGTYLTAIAHSLSNTSKNDEDLNVWIDKLTKLSSLLKESIEDRETLFPQTENPGKQASTIFTDYGVPSTDVLRKNIEALKGQLQDSEDRHEKKQLILSKRLEEIASQLDTIESAIKSRLEAVDALYSSAQQELNNKQKSVDDLLGTISASVIAGDYDSSAASEKKMADWLRIGSLACMVIIAVIIGFSLYETTTEAFKWENSLFRLVFTVLLSVPAAYLARESTKHRQQQYTHLQTSLDLKAITPYLASLPIEEQHRLKSEIANRLFAPRDYASSTADSYPVNAQELLIKLLDKIELKSPGNSDNSTAKKG